jgi:hypothetical protein
MKGRHQYFKRFHQKIGWWGTVLLMLPILFFIWLVAQEPFLSVVSGKVPYNILIGKLFSEKFDIGHARGIRIGLIWFSFMAVVSLPYSLAVRWSSNLRNRAGYLAYSISMTLLCIFLLCILLWPVCWLIQYIHSMGVTPRRIFGLVYGIAGFVIVIRLLCWAIKRPEEEQQRA